MYSFWFNCTISFIKKDKNEQIMCHWIIQKAFFWKFNLKKIYLILFLHIDFIKYILSKKLNLPWTVITALVWIRRNDLVIAV